MIRSRIAPMRESCKADRCNGIFSCGIDSVLTDQTLIREFKKVKYPLVMVVAGFYIAVIMNSGKSYR